jgi:O-antigen ligase
MAVAPATARSVLFEGVAAILDAVGIVLFFGLLYLVMFASGYSFQNKGLAVGAIGLLARVFSPEPKARIPIPLSLFVAVASLSAAVHQWGRFTDWSKWPALLAPASHLFVMLIFVAGVSHLLRGRRRLSLLLVGLSAAALVLSIQATFDQAVNGFQFQPQLQVLVPSVAQWGGIHDLALACIIAIPIVLAPAMIARSWQTILAGVLLSSLPVLSAIALGARSAVVVVMPIVFAMVGVAAIGPRSVQRYRWILVGVAVAALSACLAIMVWKGILSSDLVRNMSGRTDVWYATARLIQEEPLLGVGPGGYANALAARGLGKHIIGPGSAHNLVLHIAAEVGLVGAALWIALLFTMMKGCWQVFINGTARVLGGSLFFMLAVMVVQWTVESFIEGSFFVERHRLLVWSVFAAAVAVKRAAETSPVDNAALI